MIELDQGTASCTVIAPSPEVVIINGWTVRLMCDTLTPQSCVTEVHEEIIIALNLCPSSIKDYIYEYLGSWEIRIYPDGWNPFTEDYGGTSGAWATITHCGVCWPDTEILLHEIGHGLDWALGTISRTVEWHNTMDQVTGDGHTDRAYMEYWASAIEFMLSGAIYVDGKTFCEARPSICDFVGPIVNDPWSYR